MKRKEALRNKFLNTAYDVLQENQDSLPAIEVRARVMDTLRHRNERTKSIDYLTVVTGANYMKSDARFTSVLRGGKTEWTLVKT